MSTESPIIPESEMDPKKRAIFAFFRQLNAEIERKTEVVEAEIKGILEGLGMPEEEATATLQREPNPKLE